MSFMQPIAPTTTLGEHLKAKLSQSRPARGYKKIHASDLTKDDFCPRKVALVRQHDIPLKPEKIPPALAITFDVGNKTAELLANSWARDIAVGHWKCSCCKDIKTFCKAPAKKCECSHWSEWQYMEVGFEHTPTKASGSVDMLFDLGAPKLALYEVKIMAPDAFEKIKTPLAEHRARTVLYMDIIRGSTSVYRNSIDTTRGTVFYFSRGHGKKNEDVGAVVPWKEYPVSYDPNTSAEYFAKAAKIKLFEDTGELPERVCPSSFCSQAKYCEAVSQCFGGTLYG